MQSNKWQSAGGKAKAKSARWLERRKAEVAKMLASLRSNLRKLSRGDELKQKFFNEACRRAVEIYFKNRQELPPDPNVNPKVGCVMFYMDDGELKQVYKTSGGVEGKQKKFDTLRETSGVAKSKPTFCAEEHILVSNPNVVFLFSVAFRRYGFVPPCSNGQKGGAGGCCKLLKHEGIFYMW